MAFRETRAFVIYLVTTVQSWNNWKNGLSIPKFSIPTAGVV